MERKGKNDDSYRYEELRANFKQSLSKLLQISTRDQAMKEVKALIIQNKTTNNLRLWLSVLSEGRNKHSESEISVIGFIVQQYGKGLLDPLDKIPSLQKTIFRITELLIKFFNQNVQNVQYACQKVWVDLYLIALQDEELQIKKKLLYNNLQAIINGGADKISQTTAQIILDGLLEVVLNKEDHIFFKEIAKRILVLFLKTTVYHAASLTCLQTIISYFNIMNLLPLGENIVNKILFYITNANNNSIGYKIKSQACNALSIIGQQVDNNGMEIYVKIIKVLQNMAIDKVWAVQVTGRKALAIWNKNKNMWDQEFQAKQQQYYQPNPNHNRNQRKQPEQVENSEYYEAPKYKTQNQMKRFQNNNWIAPSKINQVSQQQYPSTQEQFHKANEDDQKQYQKVKYQTSEGWNRNKQIKRNQEKNRSKSPQNLSRFPDYTKAHYLHKNTGVGGGNTVQSVENYYERQKPQETYHKKMEEIKKSIYNPKSQQYTEYDETIPWNQAQNLPKMPNNSSPMIIHEKPSKIQAGSSNVQDNEELADVQFLKNWEHIIALYQNNKKQQAVKELIQMDDDVYFIRFLLKYSQGLLKDLTRPTSAKVLKRILQIKKTNFMEQMLFKMVGESAKGSIGQLLTNNQNMTIVNKLDNSSKIQGLEKISAKLKAAYQKSLES